MADDKTEFSALEHTIAVLDEIPGGAEVIEWFGGRPSFRDAEVLDLRLAREGPSVLRVSARSSDRHGGAGPARKDAIFTFVLRDMIDVHLDGFGHQNVIGGLALRRNPVEVEEVHRSLVGIGLVLGDHEIALAPCAGAFGIIRCTIESISMTAVNDYQQADGSPPT
jgi:hypothetical protein